MKRMGDLFAEGIGGEADLKMAMMFYQNAEVRFYKQMEKGDPYVRKDLDFVINAQEKLRKQITRRLPTLDWNNDDATDIR